jgi:predicted metalloprotease with PDZ domain
VRPNDFSPAFADPPSRGAAVARWLRIAVGVGVGLSAVLFFFGASGDQPPLRAQYHVQIENPVEGIVHVRLQIAGHRASRLRLGFSANAVANTAPVSKFRVRRAVDASGADLDISRERGHWVIARSSDAVTIEYEAHLLGQRDSDFAREVLSRLDGDGGRLLGSDIFLFPVGRPVNELSVDFDLPTNWNLYHPFQSAELEARPPTVRSLYNSAMAVGPYRSTRRQIDGIDVVLAVQGRFAFGDDDLMRVISDIVAQQLSRFGAPNRSRYVFVVNEHPDRDDPVLLHYFGLHFDGSMVVLIDPRTDRKRLRHEPASLCAHEFFHNWLGELVRQENYDMNWFIEGVTTWYAYQSLIETRMLDSGSFAEDVQSRYERIERSFRSRDRLSVASAGQHVLQDSNTTQMLYSGGLFVAIALDEAIGAATRGEENLEALLEILFGESRRDPERVFSREGLETSLRALTGEDFGDWLDRYAYGSGPVDLPEFVTDAR